jgi:hypothetical protein
MIHCSSDEFEGSGPASVCFIYSEVKRITYLACFIKHPGREVNDAYQPDDGALLAGHKVQCTVVEQSLKGIEPGSAVDEICDHAFLRAFFSKSEYTVVISIIGNVDLNRTHSIN